jgi:hypothetical protein
MENRIITIEKQLSSLEASVKGIHYDMQRVRNTKSELPSWLRNSAIAILMAIFMNVIASVWWASGITNTQETLIQAVAVNTEERYEAADKYQAIMIELNKLTVSLSHMTDQNQALLDVIHRSNGVTLEQ